MKYRILSKAILKALKTFPAVVVTGPRQSGKTTLLKHILFKKYSYVNLENPDVRSRALEDPVSFIENYHPPIIIDEIQYAPKLLSYIKTKIDEKRTPGQWVLTGSQNFTLMQGVSQSLAGRAAVLSLLPFSLSERLDLGKNAVPVHNVFKARKIKKNKATLADIILRGSYPEIASQKKVDRDLWCGSFINTYLERDVRNLSQVGDLGQFEKFVRLCAARTGQILNLSDLARDVGVSVPTAKQWLSLLETGYQVFLLYPYYKNIGKRLVKSPKLYFTDTGLASYLLGINNRKILLNSPYFANLFETFVIIDFWKRFLHFGQMPSLYYFRTRDGLEVDLILEYGQTMHLIEIKSGMTILPHHAVSLNKAKKDLKFLSQSADIISQAKECFPVMKNIYNYNWLDLMSN